MAQDVNTVTISGHLTRDPELRATAGGTNILNLGVAVNERRKNSQTGEWSDVPCFVDVVLFGGAAEWMSRELRKGKLVMVCGKLRQNSWEAKDGTKRSKLEVIADTIQYERPPRQQDGQSGNYSRVPQNAPQTTPQAPAGTSQAYMDQAPIQMPNPEPDDIPFGG